MLLSPLPLNSEVKLLPFAGLPFALPLCEPILYNILLPFYDQILPLVQLGIQQNCMGPEETGTGLGKGMGR